MALDTSRFVVGDEWVYRVRGEAASERVRIQAVVPKKNSVRPDVAFVDDPVERVENVPGSCLRAPWSEAAAYDGLMANWRRIGDEPLDDAEKSCVEDVFGLLIPGAAAELIRSPVSCATAIHDRTHLEPVIGRPAEEILSCVEWFDLGDSIMVSPAGTLLVVEAACRVPRAADADPRPDRRGGDRGA